MADKGILLLILYISFSLYSPKLLAQAEEESLVLRQLVELASNNYPLIKAKLYRIKASEYQVATTKNSIMPSLDAAVQTNLATHNNISGMSYPQYLLPISGPPSSSNNYEPVFGSAGSLLLNWQPVTFGLRKAQINESSAALDIQTKELDHDLFQIKVRVIETYLDWLIGFELEKVEPNNIERNQVNLLQSKALSRSGIRPGSDTAVFISELSKSKIALLQLQLYTETKRIMLEKLINLQSAKIGYDSTFLTQYPGLSQSTEQSQNPAIGVFQSRIAYAEAKKHTVSRLAYPKLTVWGTTFMRGSGIDYAGAIDSFKGFSPSRFNYGVGLQLAIPLLKFKEIRLLKQQQDFIVQSNEQELAQQHLELNTQSKLADRTLHNAQQIALEAPVQLAVARQTFEAQRSRYKAGLIDFSNLLQAQYSLAKAESDLKKSYLEVWKALLFKAAVAGDLGIFLNEVK